MAYFRSEEFRRVLEKYESILIYIKGSPDPDAIASGYAISLLCEELGRKAVIFSPEPISLEENRRFVAELAIPIRFEKLGEELDHFKAYGVVDFQSARVEGITGTLPCAFHIDHHEPIDEKMPVDFKLIDNSAGSTSTLVAIMIRQLAHLLDEKKLQTIATALEYGIQSDTDHYAYAGKQEYDALSILGPLADHERIRKMSKMPFSRETVTLLWEAIENQVLYRDWLIAGVGYVSESNRDSIAVVADFLLNREDASAVIVFAAIEKKNRQGLRLDASFRSRHQELNLNSIIKKITAEGGARHYKGAFQINLDYFAGCPDRALLWQVISLTTIEILKKQRDSLTLAPFSGMVSWFKRTFHDMMGD